MPRLQLPFSPFRPSRLGLLVFTVGQAWKDLLALPVSLLFSLGFLGAVPCCLCAQKCLNFLPSFPDPSLRSAVAYTL